MTARDLQTSHLLEAPRILRTAITITDVLSNAPRVEAAQDSVPSLLLKVSTRPSTSSSWYMCLTDNLLPLQFFVPMFTIDHRSESGPLYLGEA